MKVLVVIVSVILSAALFLLVNGHFKTAQMQMRGNNLEDFKGFRHENGTYSFIVNEFPIALEKLFAFEDNPLSKPEEFFKQKGKEKIDED